MPATKITNQRNIRLRAATNTFLTLLGYRLGLDGTSVIHLAINQLAFRELGEEEAKKILDESGCES
jgi:hypothetical protein